MRDRGGHERILRLPGTLSRGDGLVQVRSPSQSGSPNHLHPERFLFLLHQYQLRLTQSLWIKILRTLVHKRDCTPYSGSQMSFTC